MPISNPNPVIPLYFGPTDNQLFGCYHEPQYRHSWECAVVICQPMGHEYIYCHRALRQLATKLCDAGFPVLRFDGYGCGDSQGEAEDGTLAQWSEDLGTAINEVKTRTRASKVCLLGVRLGAALAFARAAQSMDVDSLILWEPVVLGKAYLDELTYLQGKAHKHHRKKTRSNCGLTTEVIGFPLPRRLWQELEELNLLTIVPKSHCKILIMQNDAENISFKLHIDAHGVSAEYLRIQAPKIWEPTFDGNLLVPSQPLWAIATWASKLYA